MRSACVERVRLLNRQMLWRVDRPNKVYTLRRLAWQNRSLDRAVGRLVPLAERAEDPDVFGHVRCLPTKHIIGCTV
jgi:hypothetical protein